MDLRPYQREALDAIFGYWRNGGGNPLVDLATGTGKSVVIAELVKMLLADFPAMRVVMLVHVKELVEQNARAMLRAWPQAPIGINSAGLGRRDKRSQILFASIQSVAKEDAFSLGERHLIVVDEAHLIPRAGSGMYQTFIGKMREAVPDLRVGGFTATPYRLDTGRMDEGGERLFDETVYTYDIGQGVDDGFLSPLVSRATGAVIDVSKVARRGGEFVAGDLERAANVDSVTQAACDEIVARAEDRRSWLMFCAGVEHAQSVETALRARGISVACVTGQTPRAERDRMIRDFREGRLRALTNANVLTTGFDAPRLDLIAMLRPTLSTSLYVQMLGRGTRLADGKENCLVLDFAQNVRRHGPVDAVRVSGGPKGSDGKVTVESVQAKECPNCETLVSIRSYECPHCGHEWERPQTAKHDATAEKDAPVMSREIVDRWLPVTHVAAYPHHKAGSPPSMRVEYTTGLTVYREWITIEHPGFAGAKAAKWWRSVVGTPVPATTQQALARVGEINVMAVTIRRDGKFWAVVSRRARRADGRVIQIDEKLNAAPVALQLVREAAE